MKKRAPIRHRCPNCGTWGRRKRTRRREVRHLAHQPAAFWTLIYGVYAASCACAKYFTAVIEGVGFKCGYTDGVRQKVVDLLVRDHLSVYKVQAHLNEDFLLDVSVGFIFDCFQWAYDKIDRAAYWQWALKNFSGTLCIDEVHDCGRAILVATDPVNDFTVAFLVVPRNNQRNMNRFLDLLKSRGLRVRVAVTDGSRLYKQADARSSSRFALMRGFWSSLARLRVSIACDTKRSSGYGSRRASADPFEKGPRIRNRRPWCRDHYRPVPAPRGAPGADGPWDQLPDDPSRSNDWLT